ncbi:MAG: Tat proofreading chaperone DmsD [Coriobacteriaceae bacterium]|nr:Tat proofreading chaperone DmsD [Coriobacteriaceae bacterium]
MDNQLEAVAFVGDALAPFFLQDPAKEAAAAHFEAFSQLDAEAAASEWPFGDPAELKRGVRDMVEGLAGASAENLSWEFRRLFVGPEHKAAAPWGSVYTDHDGVIFGESALALAAWMRRQGIDRLSREGDPEDHIGLLLALMAWIARNRPELLDEFLRDHVLTWSSHYLNKLEQEARLPFYRGLAVVTRESLEGIQSERGIQVEHPRYFR